MEPASRSNRDLLVPSLEVRNFLRFGHLLIDKFARVNLIVGKNGSGKTGLLHAIWLLASRGTPEVERAVPAENARLDGLNLRKVPSGTPAVPCVMVPSVGIDTRTLERWSLNMFLFEDETVQALNVIRPGIRRVGVQSLPDGGPPVPVARVEGFDHLVTLKDMGEGVHRMYGLAMALQNARGGLLLVDEIENGLHHSIHADIWKMILQTSLRLDIQVFATTHSLDIIDAFEWAAREVPAASCLVTRLDARGDETKVVQWDSAELRTAVSGNFEVR